MRILIVGATGAIGVPVVQALEVRHEVIPPSHSRSALTVDLGEAESIRRLYAKVGRVDAVVSIAGQAAFRPLLALTDANFALGLNNKLMGQVNLVRFGIEMVTDGGSFTLTSGNLEQNADARRRSNQLGLVLAYRSGGGENLRKGCRGEHDGSSLRCHAAAGQPALGDASASPRIVIFQKIRAANNRSRQPSIDRREAVARLSR
jgi:hypothetical protein